MKKSKIKRSIILILIILILNISGCAQKNLIENSSDEIETKYKEAIKLVNDKKYIEARQIFTLNEIRDYKDSLAYIYYCNGMIDYENKNYGVAIEKFSKSENILNAKELKQELISIVSKYNGTYYYNHPYGKSLSYYMFVKDGKVDFAPATSYKDNDKYNYFYSICADIYHVANESEGLMLNKGLSNEPKKEEYVYLFAELQTSDNKIIISNQGNEPGLFTGIYDKISDNSPDKK